MALPKSAFDEAKERLSNERRRWLITGVAGFIGSNLLEFLLKHNQDVVGLDNFATGHQKNLEEVRGAVSPEQWKSFRFIDGDIRRLEDCQTACQSAEFVLHQAALGSVPRSLSDPITTNSANIDGFLNMMVAARDASVSRFVYAASSSTYGDHPALPKQEAIIGRPLSPYAVTKFVNELYADVFARSYGVKCIGLRYFNVFGPRQDPNGAYAAVIPKWVAAMIRGEQVLINGDGETSRDFCFVANAVQANILGALTQSEQAINQVYNVAVGDRTSLNELFELIRGRLVGQFPHLGQFSATYQDFRPGDVRHSLADISKASELLGYKPTHRIDQGIDEALGWYTASCGGFAKD